MYACVFETSVGFFEGVGVPCETTAYFGDPPPTSVLANCFCVNRTSEQLDVSPWMRDMDFGERYF
jgi:hypothetical protein